MGNIVIKLKGGGGIIMPANKGKNKFDCASAYSIFRLLQFINEKFESNEISESDLKKLTEAMSLTNDYMKVAYECKVISREIAEGHVVSLEEVLGL
jgi:hypothetical protein